MALPARSWTSAETSSRSAPDGGADEGVKVAVLPSVPRLTLPATAPCAEESWTAGPTLAAVTASLKTIRNRFPCRSAESTRGAWQSAITWTWRASETLPLGSTALRRRKLMPSGTSWTSTVK